MSRGTVEVKKYYQIVPEDGLRVYISDHPMPGTDLGKDEKESFKIFRREMIDYLEKLFWHFGSDKPGSIIKTKWLRDLIEEEVGKPLSLTHYRTMISSIKRRLLKREEGRTTLHNIRGVGYCIATPDQHQDEVLKSFARASMYVFSAYKLMALPDFARSDRDRTIYQMIQLFDDFFSSSRMVYSNLTPSQREELDDVLSSQILEPDFRQDETYLRLTDYVRGATGAD